MGKSRGRRRKQRSGGPLGATSAEAAATGQNAGGSSQPRAPLLQKLESVDDNEREHGCVAIASLAAEGPEEIQQLLQLGTVELLSARLADHMPRVSLASSKAIRSIVTAGGGAACDVVLGTGTVGLLVQRLVYICKNSAPDSTDFGSNIATGGHILVTLTSLCRQRADAVVALTERSVFDCCLALLQLPYGQVPNQLFLELLGFLYTLVEDNLDAAAYLTSSQAPGAPGLLGHVARLGNSDGLSPLLRVLCASTLISAVPQCPDQQHSWASETAWAISTLVELAALDLLAPAAAAVSQGQTGIAGLADLQPAVRAQLKALEALTDALHDATESTTILDNSGAWGVTVMNSLLPRFAALPDQPTAAAAKALFMAAPAVPVEKPDDAASKAAVEAAKAAAKHAEISRDAKQTWVLICSVPAHVARCVANLLASEYIVSDAAIRAIPPSAIWATLFASWCQVLDACSTAAQNEDNNGQVAAVTGTLLV